MKKIHGGINSQIPPSLLLYVNVDPSVALTVDPSPPVIASVEDGGVCEVPPPPPPVEFVGVPLPLPPLLDETWEEPAFRGLMTVK
jgi:hypothetical protein